MDNVVRIFHSYKKYTLIMHYFDFIIALFSYKHYPSENKTREQATL
jgi:hypothetical protein